MSVDFNLRRFFHPVAIAKLRREFERTQWFTPDELREYQVRRLHRIVEHAYATVPYYRHCFEQLHLRPDDVRSVGDLQKLPILSKEAVRTCFSDLQSNSASRRAAHLVRTSGSSGEPVSFLHDAPSDVLEFVYYWRHWSWAGYRLGVRFAEFASDYFLQRPGQINDAYRFHRTTGRLLLNSMSVSEARVHEYMRAIQRYRPCFLKGLPSVLHVFSYFIRSLHYDAPRFRGVFSTGETLLAYQRRDIESTFHCKVYDSYGHMERTVAVSECPSGGLHINPEYGVMELIPATYAQAASFDGEQKVPVVLARVVGTGLHNFSMPLIRYDTGDLVELMTDNVPCQCGRCMPRIRRISGRQQDVIRTPDGRVITTLFIVFDKVAGIQLGQIVQYQPERLLVRIVPGPEYSDRSESELLRYVKSITGPHMTVEVTYLSKETFHQHSGMKRRAVISYVSMEQKQTLSEQHSVFRNG